MQQGKAGSGEQKPLVLVVDDEDSVRLLTKKLIERSGFPAETAANGREALEMIAARGSEFACVLLDMNMPGMDGEAVFRELRRLEPTLPVILSSGYGHDVMERFAGGAPPRFIQKPYRSQDLETAIRSAIAERP